MPAQDVNHSKVGSNCSVQKKKINLPNDCIVIIASELGGLHRFATGLVLILISDLAQME